MERHLPHRRERKKPSHERWMISYADLLTLLLALFVVLYASSTHNIIRETEEAESLVQAFHGKPIAVVDQKSAGRGIMPHQVSPVPLPVEQPAPQDPHISKALSQKLQAEFWRCKRPGKTCRACCSRSPTRNRSR